VQCETESKVEVETKVKGEAEVGAKTRAEVKVEAKVQAEVERTKQLPARAGAIAVSIPIPAGLDFRPPGAIISQD
jgi:hypothetical protein